MPRLPRKCAIEVALAPSSGYHFAMHQALKKSLAAAGVLLLSLSIYVHFLTGFYGDKQWEMVYARMWLQGSRLYTDIFQVSPPLILWLYAVPAALAVHTGAADAYGMLTVCGLCLIACAIFAATWLIALHPAFAGNLRRQAEFVALLCFVLIFRTSPIYFLDREHLFFVLTLPYLVRNMPSLSRLAVAPWLKLLAGALAGLGFCIKPHCLVVLAGIQLLFMLREKSPRILWSTENIVIYGFGAFYVLLIYACTPEYFSLVVPMAMATYSAARDVTPMIYYAGNSLWVLGAALFMLHPRYRSPLRGDIYYLLALCPFFLIYALLNNNWAYTYYPLGSITLILTGFILWEFLLLSGQYETRRLPGWRFWLGTIPFVFCLAFPFGIFFYYLYFFGLAMAGFIAWELSTLYRHDRQRSFSRWSLWVGAAACILSLAFRLLLSLSYFHLVLTDTCYRNIRCNNDYRFAAEVVQGDRTLSFGTISLDFDRWSRLVDYTGARWQTRFGQLWMLPQLLSTGDELNPGHQWIRDYVARSLASDMNLKKPDVMFVDDTDIFYSVIRKTDLPAFFSANPDFRDAWAHYRFERDINFCGKPGVYKHTFKCSYLVYRRVD